MLGAIQLEKFKGLTKISQPAASAWAALDALVGCRYTPLLYLGEQLVSGKVFWFIAERATVTLNPERHVVMLGIYENLDGEYSVVKPVQVLA